MFKKFIFVTFSIILLVYMLLPGTSSISDFPPLPSSTKSALEGDTIHVPNVAAYFSDHYRVFSTSLYYDAYESMNKIPFGPIKLNHPPEFAFVAIKDQTQSTFLEEFVYPLRSSIFVNGLEPVNEDGTPRYWGGEKLSAGGRDYATKVTIRYYHSEIWVRLAVWLGIITSVYFTFKLGGKVFSNG